MKRVIQLLRVSTDAQARDQRMGMEAQRTACVQLCRAHGLTVGHTVELTDVSGAAIMQTPEMQQLCALLQQGQYHGIVTREFSRVLRPQNYDYFLFGVMAATRTTLYSEAGTIEPWTSTGRMMVAMHGAIAANELDTIRARMMAGKEAARRAGRWVSGRLPLGVAYTRSTNTFSYTEDAARVRALFRGVLAGKQNYDQLARQARVDRITARNLLRNPIYTGWLVYAKQRDYTRHYQRRDGLLGRQQSRPKVARDPENVIRLKVISKPLVTQQEFDRVQQMMEHKRQAFLRTRVHVGEFVYNGYVFCAKCGRRLITKQNQFGGLYYLCKGRQQRDADGLQLCQYSVYMHRDRLEPLLDHVITSTLCNPKALARMAKAARAATHDDKRSAHALETQMAALGKKRDRYVDLYSDGAITREALTDKLQRVDQQLSAVRVQLASQPSAAPAWDASQLAKMFEPLAGWRTLQRAEKRALLAALQPVFKVDNYVIRGVLLGGAAVYSRTVNPSEWVLRT